MQRFGITNLMELIIFSDEILADLYYKTLALLNLVSMLVCKKLIIFSNIIPVFHV